MTDNKILKIKKKIKDIENEENNLLKKILKLKKENKWNKFSKNLKILKETHKNKIKQIIKLKDKFDIFNSCCDKNLKCGKKYWTPESKKIAPKARKKAPIFFAGLWPGTPQPPPAGTL